MFYLTARGKWWIRAERARLRLNSYAVTWYYYAESRTETIRFLPPQGMDWASYSQSLAIDASPQTDTSDDLIDLNVEGPAREFVHVVMSPSKATTAARVERVVNLFVEVVMRGRDGWSVEPAESSLNYQEGSIA